MTDIPVPKPVQDEYTSVGETTCACGAAAFVVEKQWLMQTPWGYSDWLEARCRACGATRGFAFPLPSFGRAGEGSFWKVPGLDPVAGESIWSPRLDEAPVDADADGALRRALEELGDLDLTLPGWARDESEGGGQ